jgi:hypothetical protein
MVMELLSAEPAEEITDAPMPPARVAAILDAVAWRCSWRTTAASSTAT